MILTDDEINKRLRKEYLAHPKHNILLKKNPHILEKKNLQNQQEFNQEAQACLIEVANKSMLSKGIVKDRVSPFDLGIEPMPVITHSPSKGKDAQMLNLQGFQHQTLWNFLERLQKTGETQVQVQSPALKSSISSEDTFKQNSSQYDTVTSHHTKITSPKFSKFHQPSSPQRKVLYIAQVESIKDSIYATIPLSFPPSSRQQTARVSQRQTLASVFESLRQTPAPQDIQALKQKHDKEMQNLQLKQKGKTLQARTQDVEQRVQLNMVDSTQYETQTGTLALPKENTSNVEDLFIVSFKEIGQTIQLQSVKTRCKSASNQNAHNGRYQDNQKQFKITSAGSRAQSQDKNKGNYNSLLVQSKQLCPTQKNQNSKSIAAIIELRQDQNGEILLMGPLNKDLEGVSSNHKHNSQSFRRLRKSGSSRFNSTYQRPKPQDYASKTENIIVNDFQQCKILHPVRARNQKRTRFRQNSNVNSNKMETTEQNILSDSPSLRTIQTNFGQDSQYVITSQKIYRSTASNYKNQSVITPLNINAPDRNETQCMKSTEREKDSQRLTTRRKHQSAATVTEIAIDKEQQNIVLLKSLQQFDSNLKPCMTTETVHISTLPLPRNNVEMSNETNEKLSYQHGHQTLDSEQVDSSKEIAFFTSHNIGPMSQSENRFGQVTNVNFSALPDCLTIENVDGLNSNRRELPSKKELEDTQKQADANYRNKRKRKNNTPNVLQGLLYHRPVSAHIKGLSLTSKYQNSSSFSQQLYKQQKQNQKLINSSMPVEVVNSHFKMRQKQQSNNPVLINKDINILEAKHVLDVDPMVTKNGSTAKGNTTTFTQAHASMTSTQQQNLLDNFNRGNLTTEERPGSGVSIRRGVISNRNQSHSAFSSVKKTDETQGLLQQSTTLRLQGGVKLNENNGNGLWGALSSNEATYSKNSDSDIVDDQ